MNLGMIHNDMTLAARGMKVVIIASLLMVNIISTLCHVSSPGGDVGLVDQVPLVQVQRES